MQVRAIHAWMVTYTIHIHGKLSYIHMRHLSIPWAVYYAPWHMCKDARLQGLALNAKCVPVPMH